MVSYGQQSTLGEGEALLLLPLLMHIAHTKCKVLLLLPLLPAHTECNRALEEVEAWSPL